VYDLICQADTVGIFQIESRAQMNMLRRLKPRNFYDLVIEVAIVRPGPIQGGIIHPYLRRRAGKERVTYPNTRVKEILGRTLGVPVFQEQIMEIAVTCGGFTPGEADNLRRALGSWKRNKDIIGRFGQKLRSGIIKNGYAKAFADQCIRQIKGFAEYGFPQSHAASFALLVYVSAWLKKHHPAAFAAALLNSQPMGFYHTAQIVYDTERHNVNVLPIDIHHSHWDCSLEGSPPKLRLGMRIVKGLPKLETHKIVDAVNRFGPFSSITNLWRASGASVHALKALAQADAFRSLGLDRQAALWQIQKLRDTPLPLFDGFEEQEPFAPLPEISKALHVTMDYQSAGVSLKAHPMSFIRSSLAAYGVLTASDLEKRAVCPNKALILIAGIVIVRQRPSSAAGVLFITLEDETGFSNLIIRSALYEKLRVLLCSSAALLVKATVQREEDAVSLLLEDAQDISQYLEGITNRSRDFR
jgi:error-prone DNA polymerase